MLGGSGGGEVGLKETKESMDFRDVTVSRHCILCILVVVRV